MLALLLAAAASCTPPADDLQTFLFAPPAETCPAPVPAEGLHARADTRILAGRSGNEIYLVLDSGDGREASLLVAACDSVEGNPDDLGSVVPSVVCDRHPLTFDLTAEGLVVWDDTGASKPALTIPLPADVVSVNGYRRPDL